MLILYLVLLTAAHSVHVETAALYRASIHGQPLSDVNSNTRSNNDNKLISIPHKPGPQQSDVQRPMQQAQQEHNILEQRPSTQQTMNKAFDPLDKPKADLLEGNMEHLATDDLSSNQGPKTLLTDQDYVDVLLMYDLIEAVEYEAIAELLVKNLADDLPQESEAVVADVVKEKAGSQLMKDPAVVSTPGEKGDVNDLSYGT